MGGSRRWPTCPIGELIEESRIPGSDGLVAKKITVKLYGKGVLPKDDKRQGSANTKYFMRRAGQFIYSKLDFLNGAFGIIPKDLDGFESTLDLPAFDFTPRVEPKWFLYFVGREEYYSTFLGSAIGGRKARRISPTTFLATDIPLPPLPEQQKIAEILTSVDVTIESTHKVIAQTKKVKQGLLQELLTKGIGHTKFKDTEIGRIPAPGQRIGTARQDDGLPGTGNGGELPPSAKPGHRVEALGIQRAQTGRRAEGRQRRAESAGPHEQLTEQEVVTRRVRFEPHCALRGRTDAT